VAVRHANGAGGQRGGADLQRRIDGEGELLGGLLAVVVGQPVRPEIMEVIV
jgi:hypothetical protein